MFADDKVKRNFSKSAFSYDEAASFQRRAAEKLNAFIPEPQAAPRRVLEIGCGTGFMTEKLLCRFPNAEITVTDISEEMLERCKSKFKRENAKIDFKTLDIRGNIEEGDSYDLIISALTFQWIYDTAGLMLKLRDALADNGVLVFSTLGPGTFESFKNSFKEAGVTYPVPDFAERIELEKCGCIFRSFQAREEYHTEHFDSLFEFLHNLQASGAVNSGARPLALSDMRKILKAYPLPAQGVDAEYQLVLCMAVK